MTLRSFLKQRSRWISKGKAYKDWLYNHSGNINISCHHFTDRIYDRLLNTPCFDLGIAVS